MLNKFITWLTKRTHREARSMHEPAPNAAVAPRATGQTHANIVGKLIHKKINTFGVTPTGRHSTKCPLCSEPNQHVFSLAVDEGGTQHRCCLRCLRQWGGDEQVRIAVRRSRYAKRVADCMEALDQLRTEFPDPSRRPYGEKSLLAEIELPFIGYDGIERVLAKIKGRKWTDYDNARIDGRPEPRHE